MLARRTTQRRHQWAFWMLAGFIVLMLSGCRGTGPVVPTIAPLPVTLLPEPTAPEVTTLPTEILTVTLAVTKTELPTIPPRPTIDRTAQAPINTINNGNGATLLNITAAQLNAALRRKFDDAPLANYAAAPNVSFGDGSLTMTLSIIPLAAADGSTPDSSPQTMTWIATLGIYDGKLEFQPTSLVPLNVGVTTQQVKLGHVLLLQTLNEIAKTAAGEPHSITYNYANVDPDTISLTVGAPP